MANRRWLYALTRQASALFSTNPTSQSIVPSLPAKQPQQLPTAKFPVIFSNPEPKWSTRTRHFSSDRGNDDDDAKDEEEEDDEDEGTGESGEDESVSASGCCPEREYSAEEKEAEAAAIGYKVISPLEKSDRVFKPYERVFAVVQVQPAGVFFFLWLCLLVWIWSCHMVLINIHSFFAWVHVDWFSPV